MSAENDAGIRPWTVERSEELLDCRIFKVKRETARPPRGGRTTGFYVLDSPDWVSVVPITADGNVVCIRQYRHGSRHVALETPAGLVEAGEPIEVTAARELREETGYSATSFTVLGRTYANPAFMTNHLNIVLAEGVTLTDPTAWDEHEEIEVHLVPVADIPGLLLRGEIENTTSALSLSLYLLHANGIVRRGER